MFLSLYVNLKANPSQLYMIYIQIESIIFAHSSKLNIFALCFSERY